MVSFTERTQSVKALIGKIKARLRLEHVRVALAFNKFPKGHTASKPLDLSRVHVKSVAVCAGSGSSVLSGVKADMFLTGEMTHHQILQANDNGTTVVLTDHSNTERGYLPVML